MRCKQFKNQMILCLYQELDKKKSEELKNHVKKCPECAKEWEYTQKVFELVKDTLKQDIPEADWEKCWSSIDEKISAPEKKRRNLFWFFPKWAYTAAALMCVLIIGFIIGRTTFAPGSDISSMTGETRGAFYMSLQEHFDDLKPLLMEVSHYREDKDKQTITLDKNLVGSLLVQNILLKRLASERNPNAHQLLEDIELILREITNMDEKGKGTLLRIRDFINSQELLSSIEVFRTL